VLEWLFAESAWPWAAVQADGPRPWFGQPAHEPLAEQQGWPPQQRYLNGCEDSLAFDPSLPSKENWSRAMSKPMVANKTATMAREIHQFTAFPIWVDCCMIGDPQSQQIKRFLIVAERASMRQPHFVHPMARVPWRQS